MSAVLRDPRVSIYSQDGLGLGHLRRNILIAGEILEQAQDSNVLILADSPVAPFFKLAHGIDHLKLPSIKKVTHGNWEAAGLRIEEQDLRRLRATVLRDALAYYRPNLLLVDHMPGGARGEMLPALATIRTELPECRIVLGLRDILDAEEVIRRVWEKEGAYNALRSYYDAILIYGDDHLFDARAIYRLPDPPCGIHYCGYVVHQGAVQPAAKVRENLHAGDRPFVFVSAGGGADGTPLMRAYIQAIKLLGRRAEFDTLMAVGANADPQACQCLEQEAEGLPIRVVSSTEDSVSHIVAADLVICMAGYNTISEVLYRKKKALVIPRNGPSAEQRIRAKLFNQRGLIDVLDPGELTPEALAERVLRDLERKDIPVPHHTVPMEGACRAAEHLLALLR